MVAATGDTAQVVDLAVALRVAMAGEVRADRYTRHLFSRDASMYSIEPLAVVFPRDAADVAAAVAVCARLRVPVLPRGAGTSLAGQTVARAVIVDTSRHMNAIVELDPQGCTARVQPGVVQDDLNRAAAKHGLLFGPDTSTSNRATVGGMIGNNSAGSGSVVYGMTIDHVETLEVVLSDASTATFAPVDDAEVARRAGPDTLEGRIYSRLPAIVEERRDAIAKGFPQHWRRAGGYRLDRLAGSPFDLARFVVGSEGTLVIVTEATLRLVPLPAAKAIAVGHFASVTDAIAATEDALTLQPSAVELIDRTILDLSRQKIEYSALGSMLEGDPGALLFVTFDAGSPGEAAAGVQRLADLWKRHGHGYHTLRATDPVQQAALLKVRAAGLGLLMAAGSGTRRPVAFIEDTAVDPARLPEYTERFAAVLARHGLVAGFYGHCSVGCLHIRPFMDLTQPAQVTTMRAVAEEVVRLEEAVVCARARVEELEVKAIELAGDHPGEDVAIALDPAVSDQLVRSDVPHINVTLREATAVVGPLVLPGMTACLRCLELHRSDRDPAWPLIAAQLATDGPHPAVDACDVGLATLAASVCALQVLAFVDGGTSAACDGTLEIVLPDWRIRRRSWRLSAPGSTHPPPRRNTARCRSARSAAPSTRSAAAASTSRPEVHRRSDTAAARAP